MVLSVADADAFTSDPQVVEAMQRSVADIIANAVAWWEIMIELMGMSPTRAALIVGGLVTKRNDAVLARVDIPVSGGAVDAASRALAHAEPSGFNSAINAHLSALGAAQGIMNVVEVVDLYLGYLNMAPAFGSNRGGVGGGHRSGKHHTHLPTGSPFAEINKMQVKHEKRPKKEKRESPFTKVRCNFGLFPCSA